MTYLSSSSLQHSQSNTTTFRAWGSFVSSSLTTLGITKTSDTGQIDWTSVSIPGSTNTSAGYEIRQFTDSLQSTAPILVKIEYGAGTAVSTPQVWITAGGATDGAGTLSAGTLASTATTRTAVNALSSSCNAFNGTVGVFADASAFGVLLWPSLEPTLDAGFFFGVERFRAGDGTATAGGYSVYTASSTNSGSSATQRPISFVTGVSSSSASSGWLSLYPGAGFSLTTAVANSVLYPSAVHSGWGQRLFGPSTMLVVVGQNDLSALSTFSINHYGTSRTFIAAGPGNAANSWGSVNMQNGSGFLRAFCMRAD